MVFGDLKITKKLQAKDRANIEVVPLLHQYDLPQIVVTHSKIVRPANFEKPALAAVLVLVIERVMGSDGVVMSAPDFDQYLSFLQGVENLAGS